VYLLPVIVANLLSVLALGVFTRILVVEDFGRLALAQVYATAAVGISNMGLVSVYNRNFFQYKDRETSGALFYSTIFYVTTVSGILGGVTYSSAGWFSKWLMGSPDYGRLIFWVYCMTAVQHIKGYFLAYLRNSENAKDFVTYSIGESVISLTLSMLFILIFRVGVVGMVWGPLIAGLIIIVRLMFRFLSMLPFSLDRQVLSESLTLAYPLTPVALFGVIRTQFDKYMIGLLATVGGVGIYSIAQRITYAIFVYMTAVQNVFMPQVYKRMFDGGDTGGAAIGKYLTPFAWACVGVALVIATLSEEILFLLTPGDFHDAISITMILSMYYAILFFGKQPQLIYAKKTHISSALVLFGVIVNVGLNIPFIYKWGAEGAAWATLLSGIISGTIGFLISQYYYRIEWEYGKLLLIFCTIIGSSLLLLLQMHFHWPYLYRLPAKIAAIGFYGYVGIRLNILNRENLKIVSDLLSSLLTKRRKPTIQMSRTN